MRHRKILHEEQILEFKSHYEKLAGLPVDMDYLTSSFLYGFFNRSGQMTAGYVISKGAPRCLGFIEDVALRGQVEQNLPLAQAVEVTCLWMNGQVSRLSERIWIYIWMFFDVASYRPSYIISGSAIPSLARLHRRLIRHELYFGPWYGTRKSGSIYWGSTRFLSLKFIFALGVYVNKKTFGSKRKAVIYGAHQV